MQSGRQGPFSFGDLMRKWQDLAAPDDPDSWNDVRGVWPSRRGTYESADISSGSAAGNGGTVSAIEYAFAYGTSNGVVQDYVVIGGGASCQVFSWDGATLTSRASYAGAGNRGTWSIKKYGDVSIVAISFSGAHLKA